jgi:hypothetical protein
MAKSKRDPIPESFRSIEEAADFWDTHDLGDYWDQTKEVDFKVNIKSEKNYFAVEKGLARKVAQIAKSKGVSPETLLNLWIKEKVVESA